MKDGIAVLTLFVSSPNRNRFSLAQFTRDFEAKTGTILIFNPIDLTSQPGKGTLSCMDLKCPNFIDVCFVIWRRGPDSNRRMKVGWTSPLPLGYRAVSELPNRKKNANDDHWDCQELPLAHPSPIHWLAEIRLPPEFVDEAPHSVCDAHCGGR